MPTLDEAMTEYLVAKDPGRLMDAVRERESFPDYGASSLWEMDAGTLRELLFHLEHMIQDHGNEDAVECAAWYTQYIHQRREDARDLIAGSAVLLPRMVEIVASWYGNDQASLPSRMITRVALALGHMASRDPQTAVFVYGSLACPLELLVYGMGQHYTFRGGPQFSARSWPVGDKSPNVVSRVVEAVLQVGGDPRTKHLHGDGNALHWVMLGMAMKAWSGETASKKFFASALRNSPTLRRTESPVVVDMAKFLNKEMQLGLAFGHTEEIVARNKRRNGEIRALVEWRHAVLTHPDKDCLPRHKRMKRA